VNRDIFV